MTSAAPTVPGLIVVLGGSNDAEGRLSPMSIGRLELAQERFALHRAEGWKLLLTGGFGPHFNETATPHAEYAQAWLGQRGRSATDFVAWALSGNTLEDALKARLIVDRVGASQLEIVTSDFHVPRAEWVFRATFPDHRLAFFGAPYLPSLPADERERRLAHETAALGRLKGALGGKEESRK